MATIASANGTPPASASSGSSKGRAITLTFPVASNKLAWKDAFTVVGLSGTEGISQLFRYDLDLVADRGAAIPFSQVLGEIVVIDIPLQSGSRRIFGAISRLTQKRSDATHAHYQAQVVPALWFATKITQSRIFQDLDVIEIIKAVTRSWPPFGFLDEYRIQGQYPKRPYCVQYRETDFHFLSRIMEEEGIYYYFDHESDFGKVAQMVICDTPLRHPDLRFPRIVRLDETRGGNRPEDRVTDWQRSQEVRAAKVTLWDHSFELPPSHLDAAKSPVPKVEAGPVTHDLEGKDPFELYDYPGDYAKHFDGVDRGGGDQAAKLQGVFQDNRRIAGIRMEQEALPGLILNT